METSASTSSSFGSWQPHHPPRRPHRFTHRRLGRPAGAPAGLAKLQDGKIRARFLLRDREAKFTAGFDEIFRIEDGEAIRLPYRTPVANAIAERWVGTLRRELLDHLLIFGCRHLEYVLREFVKHYEQARPHQGLGQRVPPHTDDPSLGDWNGAASRSRGWRPPRVHAPGRLIPVLTS